MSAHPDHQGHSHDGGQNAASEHDRLLACADVGLHGDSFQDRVLSCLGEMPGRAGAFIGCETRHLDHSSARRTQISLPSRYGGKAASGCDPPFKKASAGATPRRQPPDPTGWIDRVLIQSAGRANGWSHGETRPQRTEPARRTGRGCPRALELLLCVAELPEYEEPRRSGGGMKCCCRPLLVALAAPP